MDGSGAAADRRLDAHSLVRPRRTILSAIYQNQRRVVRFATTTTNEAEKERQKRKTAKKKRVELRKCASGDAVRMCVRAMEKEKESHNTRFTLSVALLTLGNDINKWRHKLFQLNGRRESPSVVELSFFSAACAFNCGLAATNVCQLDSIEINSVSARGQQEIAPMRQRPVD